MLCLYWGYVHSLTRNFFYIIVCILRTVNALNVIFYSKRLEVIVYMCKTDWVKIGRIFQTAREHKNLSQEDVAKILGVKKTTISGYETGRRRIQFENIKLLCKYLGVDIRTLQFG